MLIQAAHLKIVPNSAMLRWIYGRTTTAAFCGEATSLNMCHPMALWQSVALAAMGQNMLKLQLGHSFQNLHDVDKCDRPRPEPLQHIFSAKQGSPETSHGEPEIPRALSHDLLRRRTFEAPSVFESWICAPSIYCQQKVDILRKG